MAIKFSQPGFRFHPTDVELVMYHLKKKVTGKPVPFEAIRELDLYKFAPWDLPDKSCLKTGDLKWYFFCARCKKYANGMRANRATDIGYWKITGRDKPVEYESRTVGMIKSLVFHKGRAPRGDRTNWVMHEYRLQDQVLADAGISQDSYVLCRVFEKSGAGPKNGAQYGAPYKEEDWEDDLSNNLVPVIVIDRGSPMVPPVDPQNIVMKNRGLIIGDSTGPSSEPIPCYDCSEKHPLVDDGDVEPSLTGLKEKELPHHVGKGNNEKPDMSFIESTVESPTAEEADDIFDNLEDLGSPVELKKADSIDDLSNLGSKYAPSLMLPEDDGSYMELCDLDSPLDLPVTTNAFEQLPYKDTNSKPDLVNKFQSPKYMEDESNRDKTFLEMDGEYVVSEDLMSSITVPVKSNAPCPTFSSKSRLETADKFHGSISTWDNLVRDKVIENDRSYMELDDLVNPLVCPNEGDYSTGSPYDAGDVRVLPMRSILWDAGLPFQQVDNSVGGTSDSGYEGSVQNAGTLLGSAAGEGTFLSREGEEHVRGGQQRLAYSRSWSLLDSIPARPASAAEHPPIFGGKGGSKGSNSVFGYYGGSSSIHFKAEVTLGCKCTEEALSGKSGEEQRRSSCQYCCPGRELGKEDVVTWGGGFTFLFLLGIVMSLFWVCFFAMSAKISLYALKLILS